MGSASFNKTNISILTKSLLLFVYAFFLFLICLFAFRRPYYNWDMLAYMAIVTKMDHHSDIKQIHTITYNAAKKNIPPVSYGDLITGSYREKMAADPAAFYAQLPFYVVKPLYIGMIYLFYKAGFSLPISTVLPSILSYFLIGLLLLYWLKKYVKLFFAFVYSLLIMYSVFMVSIARISAPDSLSALLLFAAFYFIIEKPSIKWMFFFLLLSVFARLDNIVTGFIILSFLFFARKWQKRITIRQYAGMLLLLFVSYFVNTFITVRPFGWNILYYPTLVHYFNLEYAFHAAFSLKTYVALLVSHAATAIVFYHVTLFALLAFLVASPISVKFRNLNLDQLFSLLLIFIILFRFILYPNLEDRFQTGFYLCILVLLIKKYAGAIISHKAADIQKTK